MPVLARKTLASLAIRNYRRYFAGQLVSISGNWMQNVAAMWLIVELTGSGVSVGVTAALQFLPILLFGAWGGVLVDRLPRRRVLLVTQALLAVPALALFALTVSGAVTPAWVYGLVFAQGVISAIDMPARQSFVFELVGPDRVVNAVALNSAVVHTARILGPALAGVLIAVAGVALCFLVNALSFVAMLVALRRIDARRLHIAAPAPRERGELRAALRHVRSVPGLWIPLAMMVIVGTLSFNFAVILPLLADDTWQGTATTYAILTAAMGAGSVAGALAVGARGRIGPWVLVLAALGFGVVELLAAGAPTLAVQVAVLVPLGAVTVVFASGVSSSLQLNVAPEMRGRVMALYSMVFIGSTPLGAPLVGWLADIAGPRAGLVLGAAAALAAAAFALVAFGRAGELRAVRLPRLATPGRSAA